MEEQCAFGGAVTSACYNIGACGCKCFDPDKITFLTDSDEVTSG